jgi:tetratricopeptide (TPR) repeat protein
MNSREGEVNLVSEGDREGGPKTGSLDRSDIGQQTEPRGSDESRASPIARFLSLSHVREKIEEIGFPPGGLARARGAVRSVGILREGIGRVFERLTAPSLVRAKKLAEKGKYKQAYKMVEELDDGNESTQETRQARLEYGKERLRKLYKNGTDIKRGNENYRRACEMADELLKLGDDPDILKIAGQSAFFLGDFTRAKQYFDRLIALSGEGSEEIPTDVLLSKAQCCEKIGDDGHLQKAKNIVNGIIEKNNNRDRLADRHESAVATAATFLLAIILKRLNEEDGAIQAAGDAVKMNAVLKHNPNPIWQEIYKQYLARQKEG